MELKIGEIFEHEGEWYQCVKGGTCSECSFRHIDCIISNIGDCTDKRTDGVRVIFKKLEKVGEPHWIGKRLMQPYKLFTKAVTPLWLGCFSIWHQDLTIEIEIKQNQEDMEEKKTIFRTEDTELTRLVGSYVNYRIDYDTFEKAVKELYSNKNNTILSNHESIVENLKPFDLEAARNGKPVCTQNGRKARIICFDAKFPKTGNIVALVEKKNGEETTLYYYDDGHCSIGNGYDLMMLPEKHEGWVNVYKDTNGHKAGAIYSTEEDAINGQNIGCIATAKIEWAE